MRLLNIVFKLPQSTITSMPSLKVNAYHLLCLGLGIPEAMKVPTKIKAELSQWMVERYKQQGEPLKQFHLDADSMCWEKGQIGFFVIEQNAAGLGTAVVWRRTGEKRALKLQVPWVEWRIERNWVEQEAYLEREVEGMENKLKLKKLFDLSLADVTPWKGAVFEEADEQLVAAEEAAVVPKPALTQTASPSAGAAAGGQGSAPRPPPPLPPGFGGQD